MPGDQKAKIAFSQDSLVISKTEYDFRRRDYFHALEVQNTNVSR